MIRKNKWRLIISSIIILLPMLLGFFAGKVLPEEIAVHWGIDGKADGYTSSILIFIIFPIVLLAIHWLCMIFSLLIDKNEKQNKKVMEITFWIMPVISVFACGYMFLSALGYDFNALALVYVILAFTSIFVGNYLPKTTRNRSIGIKIKWTFSSDANWNATHRFAGKLYVILGLLTLFGILLPSVAFPFVVFAIILGCTVVPTVYSYRFYKKELRERTLTKEECEKAYGNMIGNKKLVGIVVAVFTVILVIVVAFVLFAGKIEPMLDDTSLTVKASFVKDIVIKYEDIDSIEYREEGVDGERVIGFGSARLLLGSFKNEEFGMYTRYTYTTKDAPCVVIRMNNRVVVVGADDEQTVKAIYERISAEINK